MPNAPQVLVATSKLSQFVTTRYAPRPAWLALWEKLLAWLAPDEPRPALTWTPLVDVQAARDGALSPTAERDAFRRSVRWFREQVVYFIDWKKGAIEGFESAIDHEGHQMRRTLGETLYDARIGGRLKARMPELVQEMLT